eukprot:COSAG06_NODE_48196_length_334_cov_0.480851_2_plen_40_part_01
MMKNASTGDNDEYIWPCTVRPLSSDCSVGTVDHAHAADLM